MFTWLLEINYLRFSLLSQLASLYQVNKLKQCKICVAFIILSEYYFTSIMSLKLIYVGYKN